MSAFATLIFLCLFFSLSMGLQAQRVSELVVYHYSGQTFLVWSSGGNSVKQYTVYRSRRPLRTSLALRQAEEQYTALPGSATNRRLSDALKRPVYFRLPGPSGTLDFSREYIVITTDVAGKWYYAVTATGDKGEFRQVHTGKNSTASAVRESVVVPSPVHQGRFVYSRRSVDVFVHWGSDRDLPGYPAMCNQPCYPFNFAVQKNGKAKTHPLVVRLHGRGDHFLNHSNSLDNPQQYVLALDDELPGTVSTSFWFGYDRGLDINRRSGLVQPPGYGVVDYTRRRIAWTLDWALTKLPIDISRVYFSGVSMGGSGVAFSLFQLGGQIAAAKAVIPRLDYRYNDSAEAPHGRSAQRLFPALWGSLDRSPRMGMGGAVYDQLSFSQQLRSNDLRRFPPLRVISGKKDSVVGWIQALIGMRDADLLNTGTEFFWDDRGHEAHGDLSWNVQNSLIDLSRYRADRSWPAFSHESANADPAKVSPGSWNTAVTWFEPIIDEADRWSVGLRRSAIEMREGLVIASGSLTTDITPRRLQRFRITRGLWYEWVLSVGREERASGRIRALRDGELTVPSVSIPTLPSRFELRPIPGPMFDR